MFVSSLVKCGSCMSVWTAGAQALAAGTAGVVSLRRGWASPVPDTAPSSQLKQTHHNWAPQPRWWPLWKSNKGQKCEVNWEENCCLYWDRTRDKAKIF